MHPSHVTTDGIPYSIYWFHMYLWLLCHMSVHVCRSTFLCFNSPVHSLTWLLFEKYDEIMEHIIFGFSFQRLDVSNVSIIIELRRTWEIPTQNPFPSSSMLFHEDYILPYYSRYKETVGTLPSAKEIILISLNKQCKLKLHFFNIPRGVKHY